MIKASVHEKGLVTGGSQVQSLDLRINLAVESESSDCHRLCTTMDVLWSKAL